jgi:hypothetical protein
MVIEYDLEAVLTHELGHLIGLDHTPDFDATMFAGYEPGTIDQRTLEEDDLLAACDAYPGMRTATCDPEPRGGLGDLCGGEGNPVDEQGVSGCASSGLGSAASLSGWGALLCGASLVLGRRRRTSGVSHDKDSA